MGLNKARKILLCLRYGIGDLVMETPALDALRKAAPEAYIAGLGAYPALQLLEGDPRLDALVRIQDWGLEHWGDRGTTAIRERIAAWLARESFDVVIDPSHAAAGLAETIWTFMPPLLDAGKEAHERALRRGMDGLGAIREAVREGWGVVVPERAAPRLHVDAGDLVRADAFLRRYFPEGEAPVGLSPVASSPLKRWPLDRFAFIADEIAETSGAPVLLFHGPQRETGAALAGCLRHPRRIIPVGEMHLRQIAALLARCRLFVGNDTGLMHMAAAIGTPVVALFGPTSPQIYLPRHGDAVALGGDHPCAHRLRWTFGPPGCVLEGRCLEGLRSCIDRIRTGEASTAIRSVLEAQGRICRMPPGPGRRPPRERGDFGERPWPI